MSGAIAHTVGVTGSGTISIPLTEGINTLTSVVVSGAIFAPARQSVVAPAAVGQRYPAIPAEFLTPDDMVSTTKVLQALRERVEIFSRDLSLIHISEPTRPCGTSRMPSSA